MIGVRTKEEEGVWACREKVVLRSTKTGKLGCAVHSKTVLGLVAGAKAGVGLTSAKGCKSLAAGVTFPQKGKARGATHISHT